MALKHSPILFCDMKISGFCFVIKQCPERRMIERMIKEGGGEIVEEPGDFGITLAPPDYKPSKNEEVYSTQYIKDCIKNDRIQDINLYRLNRKSRFPPSFDAMDVLEKRITWDEAAEGCPVPICEYPWDFLSFGDNDGGCSTSGPSCSDSEPTAPKCNKEVFVVIERLKKPTEIVEQNDKISETGSNSPAVERSDDSEIENTPDIIQRKCKIIRSPSTQSIKSLPESKQNDRTSKTVHSPSLDSTASSTKTTFWSNIPLLEEEKNRTSSLEINVSDEDPISEVHETTERGTILSPQKQDKKTSAERKNSKDRITQAVHSSSEDICITDEDVTTEDHRPKKGKAVLSPRKQDKERFPERKNNKDGFTQSMPRRDYSSSSDTYLTVDEIIADIHKQSKRKAVPSPHKQDKKRKSSKDSKTQAVHRMHFGQFPPSSADLIVTLHPPAAGVTVGSANDGGNCPSKCILRRSHSSSSENYSTDEHILLEDLRSKEEKTVLSPHKRDKERFAERKKNKDRITQAMHRRHHSSNSETSGSDVEINSHSHEKEVKKSSPERRKCDKKISETACSPERRKCDKKISETACSPERRKCDKKTLETARRYRPIIVPSRSREGSLETDSPTRRERKCSSRSNSSNSDVQVYTHSPGKEVKKSNVEWKKHVKTETGYRYRRIIQPSRSKEDSLETGSPTRREKNLKSKVIHISSSSDTDVETNSTSSKRNQRKPTKPNERSEKTSSQNTKIEEEDSDSTGRFFNMRPIARKKTRREYVASDRKKILEYIIQHKGYEYLKGRQFWEKMEAKKILQGRTWQSLKNHFLKTIMPTIDQYGLSSDEVKRFKRANALYAS